MLSLIKRSYYRIFSAETRAKLWRLRAKLRRLLSEVLNSWRRLYFHFTGHCKACRGQNLVRHTKRNTITQGKSVLTVSKYLRGCLNAKQPLFICSSYFLTMTVKLLIRPVISIA